MENDNVYSIIGYKINEILIVDDSSNFNDRQEMLLHTKNCKYCNFIFKGIPCFVQRSITLIYSHMNYCDDRLIGERTPKEHEYNI